MVFQKSFQVTTPGRGTINISSDIAEIIGAAKIPAGICHVFLHHTSASLIISENADPDVHTDLETFMGQLVPDGFKDFLHAAEGPDDMPAHIRNVLTQTSVTVPVAGGELHLGTWQGIYLWEHRTSTHLRRLTVTVLG